VPSDQTKEFALRDFLTDDFEAIWKLDQICFTRGIAYSKKELAHFIRQPRAFTLIAEENKQIRGFVVVERDLRQNGRIITIDVHPQARRTGLGSLLMEATEDRLRRSGASKVILEVAVDNGPAISFYKRHGYSVVGTIPRYYLDSLDALRMEKETSGS
jgi:[ribosomal protein S18]-alanine N-acetyltransferase